MLPTKQEIEDSFLRVRPFVHNTSVLTSSIIDQRIGGKVFFKCENFQRGGAFKMRGAINAILQLSEAQKQNGVLTHSSGNFAQAVALAARNIGIKAYIVMPSSAPKVKQEAVASYGGIITMAEPTLSSREWHAQKIMNETGATFLHPSNDLSVILGQGTAARELLETQPNLDYILCPIGGGGLIAGTALSAHYFGANCKVIGAEPFEVDDAFRSLKSGTIQTNTTTHTIADGLKTNLGDVNFPIIKELVSDIIRVDENQIINAMKYIWERMKIIIEPSSAVPFAALLGEKERFKNKNVGIIISGGNVDLSNMPF